MRLLRPLAERDFALLFAGTLVSLLGDGIYVVALPFAVLDLHGSPSTLSLVGLAWSLGMVGFLLAGGVMADRGDKRRILLAADALRLVALVVAGALALSDALEVWHLAGLGLMYGIGEGLSGPAMGSIIPELVSEPALVQANALSSSLRPVAMRLVGPGLGGAAVALLGVGGSLLLDAGTFLVSMACLLAIRSRSPLPTGPAEPLRSQLREAARFVRSETWLWATLLMAALALLCFLGPTQVLLPFRVADDLGGSAGDFGLVLAAGGAASTVGSLVLGHRGMPAHPVTVLYWVWGLATLGIVGYALATSIWQLVLCSVFFGLFEGAGNPMWSTLMQTRVPAAMRGRVSSMDWLVSVGLTPVSFALVGPISSAIGVRETLFAAGALCTAATLVTLYAVPGLRERGPVSPAVAPDPR
jgi:DHA3 family tetracycline resistance protein-like MFS transporter